ncbi:F-box protein At3g07870-like [Andrographis paniculata]|uniref:F-box protein At3g07870-like n=1 Tax=Andrographis paniculata TaxID=175694 RepID=UPI0021E7F8EC|nr:F-box protein At3g07870-like [Andrographis paniculata]
MDSLIKKPKLSCTKLNVDSINPFSKLPHETIVEILSRLPVKSLIQFTFTCKTLHPLSTDPLLIKLHLSRSDSSYLIIHSKNPLKTYLYFLHFSDQKIYKFETPFASSMSEFSILGSSNGLLCLIDSLFNRYIYLYNPFTRDYFKIPTKHDSCGQIVFHGFGFDPVGCDYKVVKIAYCQDEYTYHYTKEYRGLIGPLPSFVEVYSKRSNNWTRKGIIPYTLEIWSSPGVLVSNKLHWVTVWVKKPNWNHHKRLIVSYNLTDDTINELVCPCSDFNCILFGKWVCNYLGVLDKCLCISVPMREDGAFDVWVMRDYGVDESWVKEYSICIHFPGSLISQSERSYNIWLNRFGKKRMKVLCVLENGEVLLEYIGHLVAYDPYSKTFKELKYKGMPRFYQATFHNGSLVSPHLG